MTRLKRVLASALLAAAVAGPPVAATAAEDTILVEVDRAKVVRLNQPAQTVIIGNPSIADASVQSRDLLVVTGKSFGVTNLVVLDHANNTIEDLTVHVRGDDVGIVTIQKGPARVSFSCAPTCERTLMLGDFGEHYEMLNDQIQARLGLAEGQANPN